MNFRNKVPIIFYPIYLLINIFSWVKNVIIYSILKRKLLPSLLKDIPYPLSARVLCGDRYTPNKISKVLTFINKSNAWKILLELEKINKDKFLEILKRYSSSMIKEYLYLESMTGRKRIMRELGIVDQRLLVDSKHKKDVLKSMGSRRNIEEFYDNMNYLRQEADHLYQYGESSQINMM